MQTKQQQQQQSPELYDVKSALLRFLFILSPRKTDEAMTLSTARAMNIRSYIHIKSRNRVFYKDKINVIWEDKVYLDLPHFYEMILSPVLQKKKKNYIYSIKGIRGEAFRCIRFLVGCLKRATISCSEWRMFALHPHWHEITLHLLDTWGRQHAPPPHIEIAFEPQT